jgi:hypothetical protein
MVKLFRGVMPIDMSHANRVRFAELGAVRRLSARLELDTDLDGMSDTLPERLYELPTCIGKGDRATAEAPVRRDQSDGVGEFLAPFNATERKEATGDARPCRSPFDADGSNGVARDRRIRYGGRPRAQFGRPLFPAAIRAIRASVAAVRPRAHPAARVAEAVT